MRLVNWNARDVKPARLALNLRLPLVHQASRSPNFVKGNRHGYLAQLRLYATTSEVSSGLIGSHDLPQSLRPLALVPKLKPERAHVQDAASFGKWQWLLNNPRRLAVETDFEREGPARRWANSLLVDQLDNHGDFELWSCLLQHIKRRDGDQGVHKLWRAFWGRKSLFHLQTLSHKIFWNTFVEAALRLDDEKFLNSVYLYAEFMGEVYNAKWPDLYTTIVPYFLRTQQHEKAVKWHLRLVPKFYPGSQEFIGMMQNFSTSHTLSASFTLQSLYIASPERHLYDAIVPYLYGRGQSRLARLWRTICVKQDDGPRLYAPSRQFLRYLLGYFSNVDLHPREAAAVREPKKLIPGEEEQQIEMSREFMNNVHGKTFGFTAKSYNDHLGARWFASSWIGLDLATSVVAALGIQQIGPLSLQSICLREKTSQNILARIAQLESAGVAIPESGYAKTVQHFARAGDDELLMQLLKCDIHPDVFDDLELQAKMMASSSASGDLATYTLLLASRLACVTDAARVTANTMLQIHVALPNYDAVLHLLDDVRGAELPLDIETCQSIFSWIDLNIGRHKHSIEVHQLRYAMAVCQRLSSMDIPVPVVCWERIIYGLGRCGFLSDLYSLALELADHYTTRQSPRPGFVPIHKTDIPRTLTKPLAEVGNLMGLYIPQDTPLVLPKHPMNRIFRPKWQTDLLRWSFRDLSKRDGSRRPLDVGSMTQRTSFERAIDLLRMLQERGLRIDTLKVQKALCIRLAELYGSSPSARKTQQQSSQNNPYSLTEVKAMIDEAWGSELLPPMAELETKIQKYDEGFLRKYHDGAVANQRSWEAEYPRQREQHFDKQRQRTFAVL
ncbi:pentatricopeptide repeat domain-containing protein-like protein [Seiridium cupressi]